jgi:hypothetical protein
MSACATSPLIVPMDLNDRDNIWSLLFCIGHDTRASAVHMQRAPGDGHWHGFWVPASGERAIGWQVGEKAWPTMAAALRRRQQSVVDLHLTLGCARFVVSGFWLSPGSISYLYVPEMALGHLWNEMDGIAHLKELDQSMAVRATNGGPSGCVDVPGEFGTEGRP